MTNDPKDASLLKVVEHTDAESSLDAATHSSETTTSTNELGTPVSEKISQPQLDETVGTPATKSPLKPISSSQLNGGVLPMLDAIVAEYPHDAKAFTQGLELSDVDGILYESVGQYGRSSVRRVDITTGDVLKLKPLERKYFGEGICIVGDRIIMLTWRRGAGFVYDRHTFEQLDTFTFKTNTRQGWGIAYDPDSNVLLVTDGSEYIHHWDPETFKELRRVRVMWRDEPMSRLNELALVGGELLANIWFDTRIARINFKTGVVNGFLDFTGLYKQRGSEDVLNGIAFDAANQQLLITGKQWPSMYRVDYAHVLASLERAGQ